MPPVPNENESLAPVPLVSKEPVDIENLLKLNPKIKPYTNAVPSAVTKKVRSRETFFESDNNLSVERNIAMSSDDSKRLTLPEIIFHTHTKSCLYLEFPSI